MGEINFNNMISSDNKIKPREEIIQAARELIPAGTREAYIMEARRHVREPASSHGGSLQLIVFYDGIPTQSWIPLPMPSGNGKWFQRAEMVRTGIIEYTPQLLVTNGTKEDSARRDVLEGDFDCYKLTI